MYGLMNAIKREAQSAMSSNISVLCGVITNFDPTTWKIQVTFYPEIDTPYQPGTANIDLGSTWVGNGWGAYFWPTMGARVAVLFEYGNYQSPIGAIQLFDQAENLPLQGIAEGEMHLVHESGSKIVFSADGSITISANTTLNLEAATAINLTAPIINASSAGGAPVPLETASSSPTTVFMAE